MKQREPETKFIERAPPETPSQSWARFDISSKKMVRDANQTKTFPQGVCAWSWGTSHETSCQQQYTYIRCINSLRQLGASTRLVRQLAASTRCVNSLHQPVCINSVHQLGASGIHRLHQRQGCNVDPDARLQRLHQFQVTAYTPDQATSPT